MLNQNMVNNEQRVDRVKVSSAGTTSHPYLGSFPTVGCFPAPVTKTGTFITDNASATGGGGTIVFGTGTLFLTELSVGDFLYNAGKVRRIKSIQSDTQLTLEYKFPASLSSGQAVAVPPKKHYKMITSQSVGTADATLQEQLFAQGKSLVTGGTPISYDVSTSNAAIEFSASM